MPRMTARDVYIAIVVGGGLLGAILMAVGTLLLAATYSGGNNEAIDLAEGVTFFAVGAAFLIVSLIQVPARRMLALESSANK